MASPWRSLISPNPSLAFFTINFHSVKWKNNLEAEFILITWIKLEVSFAICTDYHITWIVYYEYYRFTTDLIENGNLSNDAFTLSEWEREILLLSYCILRVCSQQVKAGKKAKKNKGKRSEHKRQTSKKMFAFRVCFCSVWTELKGLFTLRESGRRSEHISLLIVVIIILYH